MADVIIKTLLDGSAQVANQLDELKRRSKELGEQSEKTSRDWRKFSDTLGTAGKAAAAAGVTILGSLAAISAQGVRASSDAEEIRSKFQAVFKDSSDAVEDWANTSAAAFNRSSLDLQRFSAGLQDTFVPLGFARDSAAQMSMALTELAIDMASFNNVSEEDTMRDLQSAIVGNHETMRKYGVVIQQTTLNAELLRMGILGGATAATEQQKAAARLSLILKGTQDAQGDAARTSGSLANMWRGMQAAGTDAAVAIGDALNPAARAATQVITGLLRGVAAVPRETIQLIAGVTAAAGALLTLGGGALFVVSKLPALIEGFRSLSILTGGRGLLGVFRALSVATLKTAGAIAFKIGVVAALGTAAVLLVRRWEAVLEIFTGVGQTIRAVGALIFNTMTKGPSEAMRIFTTDMINASESVERGKAAFVEGFKTDIAGAVDVAGKKFFEAKAQLQDFTNGFTEGAEEARNFKSALDGIDPSAFLGGDTFNLNQLGDLDAIELPIDVDAQKAQEAIEALPPFEFALIEPGSLEAQWQEVFETRNDIEAASLEQGSERWQEYWAMRQQEMEQFTEISQSAFDDFTTGVGDSVGQAIVFGEDFGASMKKLFQNIAASIISSLIKIVVQRVIMAGIMKALNISEGSSRVGTLFAETYAGAYASTVSIPVIGPIIAPGVAGAALAAVTAGTSGAAATGAGVGAAAGSAEGGFDFIPDTGTFQLHKGEKVLTRKQNRELDQFLRSQLSDAATPPANVNNFSFEGPVFADEITIDEMADMLTERMRRRSR